MCHVCAEHILYINLFLNMLLFSKFIVIIMIIIIANIHGVFANFQALY